MCGIVVRQGSESPFHHRLLQSLRKRGPDGIGFWTEDNLHLAHTRLSIIGLDDRGSQPLENDTHVLVYNGEIYNFIDLKNRLSAEGCHLHGANDAEVLLHAWSRWGEKVLPQLNGFWSFVIFDKRSRKLSLVRDQFGVKPLYYAKKGETFYAASMMRTIRELMPETPELDYVAMSEYVRYQFTFGDKTLFKDFRKVLPGHIVEYDLRTGGLTSRCYEDILSIDIDSYEPLTPRWIDETRRLMTDCLLESTVSDIPFTTTCSGGIDSSIITLVTRPQTAYHGTFNDPDCNETFYAQQVVENTGIQLEIVNSQENFNLVARLRELVGDFDELSIGSVIFPLDDLLAHVGRRYRVILTGTGGDELFAGYVRYQLALGECNQDTYRAMFERVKRLPTLAERFEYTHAKGDPAYYKFFEPGVKNTFFSEFEAASRQAGELESMLRFDRRNFLPGLLNIDDKIAARHSMEGRPSFLHQKLVRHVQRLDQKTLLHDGRLKSVLLDLTADILPKSVIQRTDKMGFTTPIGSFINGSSHLIREQLTESRFAHLYDLRRMNYTAETKFSREVFGLLILDLWLNRYAVPSVLPEATESVRPPSASTNF